jgi:RNA polymerase sigma-70 factor (ECF subfamily)
MEASRALVEKYLPLLRMMARQLRLDQKLQARFDAEDIAHDAATKAIANLDQFRGTTEAEFVGWLRQVLHNTFRDKLEFENADKRAPEMEAAFNRSSVRLDEFLADQGLSPSRKAEMDELALRIAEALEKLPPRWREVVMMRDVNQMHVKEIAEQLGETPSAVAGLLHRARKELRKYFPEYQEGKGDE